ncbi:hypothetical protein JHK82_019379 [Glycine max]|nr:hypothetical protein JHK82_019379 [Glycine max]
MLANPKQGAEEGFKFVLKKWQPYYFACGERNGFHCNNGQMKFASCGRPKLLIQQLILSVHKPPSNLWHKLSTAQNDRNETSSHTPAPDRSTFTLPSFVIKCHNTFIIVGWSNDSSNTCICIGFLL